MTIVMNSHARSVREVRRQLAELGFWHATGLVWIESDAEHEGIIQALPDDYGFWSPGNEWTIAVLKNGEIWFLKGQDEVGHRKILRKLCPRGRKNVRVWKRDSDGEFLPSNNNRILDGDHIGARVRDPYSFCNGYADPNPKTT